jgi:hypothetical protein
MPKYIVRFPLKHDCVLYHRGEVIELDEAAAEKAHPGTLERVRESSPAQKTPEQQGK